MKHGSMRGLWSVGGGGGRSVLLVGMLALGVRLLLLWVLPLADRGDLVGWEEAARRVTLAGVQHAYARLDPGSLYPPAFFYPLWLTGKLYLACCSPDFELGTRSLDVLMRLGPVLVDSGVACLVWALARTWSPARAVWAGVLYAVCPAVLVTVEQQAMIADPYIAALMLLAILALQGGRPAAAAASATLAALIKPQALALVPLIVMLTMRRASRGQQLTAVIVGAVTGLAVVLPFVGDGTWPELFAAVRAMAGLHANTQNSADNLWTLLPVWRIPGQVVGPFGAIPDNTPVLAGLSYRDVGLLAFGSLQVFTLSAVWRRFSPRHVAQGAAVLGLGFFLLNTRMHVNYVFLAFPFLCALAGTRQPGARLVLACVTLACIVDWQDALPWAIHRANAALYATSFVTLCLASGLRRVVGAVRARLDGCTAHPVSEPPLSPPEIRAAPGRPAS